VEPRLGIEYAGAEAGREEQHGHQRDKSRRPILAPGKEKLRGVGEYRVVFVQPSRLQIADQAGLREDQLGVL
jgi:hypothetical protein